jgi:hypothetical protein
MSATISGLIVLENPRAVDGSPSSIEFDGQMWLGTERSLTGIFRYYNAFNDTFPDIGYFFAWIHVCYTSTSPYIIADNLQIAKYLPLVDPEDQNEYVEVNEQAPGEQPMEVQKGEEMTAGEGSGSSDTLREHDSVHVVGDIIRVRCHFL